MILGWVVGGATVACEVATEGIGAGWVSAVGMEEVATWVEAGPAWQLAS